MRWWPPETAESCGNDFALGVEARCRALLSDGATAEELYREAIELLGRTRLRPELARAHLLYGEWLRRENRRAAAREQLRAALEMFATIGMEAFADRARGELLATGEKGAQAHGGDARRFDAQERRSRGWPGKACRIRRSARGSSSARGPWSGTCECFNKVGSVATRAGRRIASTDFETAAA